MAPVTAIPRLLARHGMKFDDIALWEIHEAFSAQVLCHIKALEDAAFVRAKSGVEHTFGSFPRERMNPNGGSVAHNTRRHRLARWDTEDPRQRYTHRFVAPSKNNGSCHRSVFAPR